MIVSIVIPTLKHQTDVVALIDEVTKSLSSNYEYDIFASCIKQSAAKNRNWCIEKAKGEIIVMIDDDVHVVQPNWVDILIQPLIDHPDKISIIAPRLVDGNKNPAPQLGNNGWYDLFPGSGLKVATHTPETKLNVVCSACIAFRKDNDVWFCEEYPSAVYEDSDFCMLVNQKFPEKKIIINENSKLHHLNEGKWRKDGVWAHNKALFGKRWGINL